MQKQFITSWREVTKGKKSTLMMNRGVSRAVSFVESSAAKEVITMKSKLRNADVS